MEIGMDHVYTVSKERWDVIDLQRLADAADVEGKADLAAVVMQEGLCHICIVTSAMTVNKARIERRMPKKKQGNDVLAKATEHFFNDVYLAVKGLKFDLLKVVILGSPGFLKVLTAANVANKQTLSCATLWL